MAILGCNVDINFGQTLAPGSSLSNTLRTKLHPRTESSIIVEFIVKLIWQHNLSMGSYGTFKMPPRRLDFWRCSKGKKWDSKTTSQRNEPKWLLKYLITLNVCAKFQPNRLTATFGPWKAYFSDSDNFKIIAHECSWMTILLKRIQTAPANCLKPVFFISTPVGIVTPKV